MNTLNKSIDLSKIYNNKIIQILINVLFSISCASLTAILIVADLSNSVIDIALPLASFFIMLFVTNKFNLLKLIFNSLNKIILVITVVISFYELNLTSFYMLYYSTTYANIIFVIIAYPSVVTFLYWFYSKLWCFFKLFIKSLNKFEKNFLIIATSILTVAVIVIYNVTTIFTHAQINKENRRYHIEYDVVNDETTKEANSLIDMIYTCIRSNLIFTADTQILLENDTYNNIDYLENDLRQPFFSIFAFPYTIIPRLISDISFKQIYPFLIAVIQGFLMFVSIILIEKMMNLKGITRLLFIIFLSVTYPTLLFLINMEQYAISIFYLVTFIYMSINKIKDRDWLFIFSSGSLLTSGICFPLLGEKGNLKNSIKNIFFTFLKFVAVLIISAKVLLIFPDKLSQQTEAYSHFSGENTSFNVRLNMYTNFAFNTMVAPEIETKEIFLANSIAIVNNVSYRIHALNYCIAQTNNEKTNILGIIILLIVLVGFILNRKDKLSQICLFWIIFSVILMPIVGYGADENGFILYSYYFSWSFVCLLFKFFESILKKWPKIKNTIYTLAITSMCTINLYGIYKIIIFGIEHYD